MTDTTKSIDSIVISGGGLHGIMILGALQKTIDSNMLVLNTIDMFVGTSVGCIISYLLIIGLYPTEIITHLIKHQEELNTMAIKFSMMKLFKLEGGISFSYIQCMLEQITLHKTGTLFTMKSLYDKFNKILVCVTFNYTTNQIEYISHENYPDLPCVLAIKMSCSIPIIFEKCIYNGNHYIDGGVYDNLPIHYPLLNGKQYPIAFNIQYMYDNHQEHLRFNIYLYELYKILINSSGHYKCELFQDRAKIIQIKPSNANPLWTSTISIGDVLDMFSNGYNSVEQNENENTIKELQ
jgi:predicted acylesterase/phospholipase RssA